MPHENSQPEKRVLIITEDPLYGDLLRYGLVASGHDATVAEPGNDARTALRSFQPDLVLLDLFMAVTEGFRLLHWIRDEAEIKPPVLVMITAEDSTLIVEVMVAGASDVLVKPLGFPEILESVDGYLDSDELTLGDLIPGHTSPEGE